MSHALHADNCQLKTNTCDHEPPAYFYRDFSALLYLNSEFSGGSLVFAERDEMSSNMVITVRYLSLWKKASRNSCYRILYCRNVARWQSLRQDLKTFMV